MHPTRSKVLAILMVSVTILGLLISLFFLIQIWRHRQPLTYFVQRSVDDTSEILETTGDGLDVIDQVITNVYSTSLYLDDTTNAIAQTVESTNLFIDSASAFMGDDLIDTITNTQSALHSAEASAIVIDNILNALSKVPLIGIKYNPSRPLNVALGEVSDSLDPIQVTLKSFQTNLATTQSNMEDFTEQIQILDQNIIAIKNNLVSSGSVIGEYQTQVISLQSWIDKAKISLPIWINTLAWILTIIVLWMVMVQIGILLQGISMLSSNHADLETEIKQ
jgi:hypothetical protein